MKIYKMIFTGSMMLGTLMATSAYSWFSMWMGLEINLLSVIPLFLDNKNPMSSESSMKYFITQALASLILVMSALLLLLSEEFINPQMNLFSSLMMSTAILTKLGAAPFHFWFPEVIEGLSWMNSMILLSWQKIAPMMIITNLSSSPLLMSSSIIASLVISVISSMNQISLRKILAFSSINHIAWMLSTLFVSLSTWIIYFIIYTAINLSITTTFNKTKTFFINQIPNMMNNSKPFKISFMTNFLSLGGLPPFIGFLPKWLLINWMTSNNMMMMTFMLIITTLIMLFVYMRIILSSLVINHYEPKTNTNLFKMKTMTFYNTTLLLSTIFCTILMNLL